MENAGVGLGDALMLAKQGNYDGNQMWNNPFVYLILLAAFGGGFGNWGNNGSANSSAFQGTVTRAELADGLDNQDIKSSLRGIQNGLCDGFYTVGMNEKETGYKVASVGESINRNIDALRYEGAANTCKVTTAIHEEGEKTRALITCNTMQALRDTLADKDRELLYLKLKLPTTTTTTT
jgi:hypothetical protein